MIMLSLEMSDVCFLLKDNWVLICISPLSVKTIRLIVQFCVYVFVYFRQKTNIHEMFFYIS